MKSLDTVIVAGEACSKTLVKNHFKTLPNINLYNEYGPTEGTVWCLAHKIGVEDLEGNIPIGRVVSNSRVYIFGQGPNPCSLRGNWGNLHWWPRPFKWLFK